MSTIRPPAVAGMFYPADAAELRSMIQGFLAAAPADGPVPKAIIAPHAGYIYSGPVAASAYARLSPAHDRIRRVVLLGPAHRLPFHGLAASRATAFATPLGNIPLDTTCVAQLTALPQVRFLEEAHALEHSLEVQLPFLQEVLDCFSLVPLVVGEATSDEVSEVLEMVWDGPATLIIVSSDLSHYLDYETARQRDRATSQAIDALRPEAIHAEDACGRNPLKGLLRAAQAHALQAHTIDLRNSGDTAGPRDQVVGYGAYVFVQQADT